TPPPPAGQQAVANQLNDVPALKGIQPNFGEIKFVDPAVQEAPVKALLAKVAAVEEPRFALLLQDHTDAFFARATLVPTGKATPAQAANTMRKSIEDAVAAAGG